MDGLGAALVLAAFILGMFVQSGMKSIADAISELARTLRKVDVNVAEIHIKTQPHPKGGGQ